jgi:hypothetical protein
MKHKQQFLRLRVVYLDANAASVYSSLARFCSAVLGYARLSMKCRLYITEYTEWSGSVGYFE